MPTNARKSTSTNNPVDLKSNKAVYSFLSNSRRYFSGQVKLANGKGQTYHPNRWKAISAIVAPGIDRRNGGFKPQVLNVVRAIASNSKNSNQGLAQSALKFAKMHREAKGVASTAADAAKAAA